MIKIEVKHSCCGCEACVQICPQHCISFTPDSEGFSYPNVDETLCIKCGLCEKVCPVLQPYEERTPLKTLAAINKNDDVRMSSSSGGIFTLLAEQVIDEGGVVWGARFDDLWQVIFDYAETKEGLKEFRGSKYLQAKVGDSYARCKQFLDEGRKVLFSGTQCQIAGLLHYLRKPYENLLTVDFICHGVPSPFVWQRYLAEVVSIGNRAVRDIQFRNKMRGWKEFSFAVEFNEDSQTLFMSTPYSKDIYMKAFLSNLILRPSCYSCPAKGGKSHSDITIADFWGIQKVHPDMDDDRGTSLVLVNTDKGSAALPTEAMTLSEEDFYTAIAGNFAWSKPAAPHQRREVFFRNLTANKSIVKQINDALRPTLRQRLSIVKHPRALAMKLIGFLIGGGQKIELESISSLHGFVDNRTQISQISFRSKQFGWKNYRMFIEFRKFD